MTRKTVMVPVPLEPGYERDHGKHFMLTEMDAEQAEKWAWRMFLALKGTTAQVPPEVERMGMVGVFIRGLNSFLAADVKFGDLEPLLDQMFTCVQRVRDMNHPDKATMLIPGDVEEVKTRAWLRSEVLGLHVGFSVTEVLWTLVSLVTADKPQDLPTT